jgi:flagellar biosynthetic protein FliQ
MNSDLVLYLGQQALRTALLLAAPVLIVTLVVGLVVAMLQAVTSIRDMTLGLVLKIASVGVTLLFAGGWMMHQAVSFTSRVFNQIGCLAR